APAPSVPDGPWTHMAQTYTWVLEKETEKRGPRSGKTEEWVLREQIFIDEEKRREERGLGKDELRQRMWEELMYGYEVEAERYMREQERARRAAAERERARTRAMQDEYRQYEAHARQRQREARAQEQARAQEHERREQERSDKVMSHAWKEHERRWAAIAASRDALTFATIPWPTASRPSGPNAITPAAIVMFLFSTAHSEGQSRKDRIRSALLRWHPDRFRRLLGRVAEHDKAAVEEGVGIVARCLNDLMARETAATR
ncbi:hypothetical protein PLICRDRAFT_76930, partial [Plicaturopsis crispa FD-325 SS-3]